MRQVDVERAIQWVQQQLSFQPAESQKDAIRYALENKVLVVTGGPGTGKTTIIKAILKILSQMKINIMLAAFNLIPIPPLDGSKILLGFTSGRLQQFLVHLEPFGLFIIIGLLYFGALDPVVAFFRWMILSLINFLLPLAPAG